MWRSCALLTRSISRQARADGWHQEKEISICKICARVCRGVINSSCSMDAPLVACMAGVVHSTARLSRKQVLGVQVVLYGSCTVSMSNTGNAVRRVLQTLPSAMLVPSQPRLITHPFRSPTHSEALRCTAARMAPCWQSRQACWRTPPEPAWPPRYSVHVITVRRYASCIAACVRVFPGITRPTRYLLQLDKTLRNMRRDPYSSCAHPIGRGDNTANVICRESVHK